MEQQTKLLLDLRGTPAPISLLKVTQAFRNLMAGATLEVLVGDKDTREDLLRVLPSPFCQLTDLREEPSFYRIRIRKAKKARPLRSVEVVL